MDRLTYDFQIGGSHCWQVKGADNLECREVCQRQEDRGCTDCPIAKAFDRLAAYEEAGLEPEEIELMEKQRDLYVDACGGLPLRRIRELVQADKEERCDEPKRITVDDVKLMVAATKKTTSWDGKTAYDVPVGEGKCVESFPRAVRLWCDFLGVKFKWR